jgi:DNA-binding transcriptional MerR regulator
MAAAKKIGFLATSLLMGSLSVSAFAQTAPPGGNPPPGGNTGGRRNFDPAQFRQQRLDRLKTELGASDDEMQALSPKLEKVMQLQRDAGGGRGFGRRGGGQGGPGGATTPTPDPNASVVQQKVAELRTVLENKDAKPDEIKAKLDALRAAKAEAKTQLAAAQQELRGLLTQRQEAVLVENGMLD